MIAKWLGAVPYRDTDSLKLQYRWNGKNNSEAPVFLPERLKYHSSWDWAMEAFDKINKDENCLFSITKIGCRIDEQYWVGNDIQYKAPLIMQLPTRLESVYRAVCEFVKRHQAPNDQTCDATDSKPE